MKIITVDATKKQLGRLATEIAMILRGKTTVDFTPNKLPDHSVTVVNAGKIKMEAGKMDEQYKTYSGYPGGLKHESRGHLLERRGIGEVLMRTVRGMLPRNKLRPEMLKRLKIEE